MVHHKRKTLRQPPKHSHREGQYWRDVRKRPHFSFSPDSGHWLDSLKHVRVSEIDSFIKGLHQLCATKNNHPPDHHHHHHQRAVRATDVKHKRFATGTNGEEAGEGRRLKKAIKEALYLSAVFVWSDWIPWPECLDVHGHVSSMKRTFKEIDLLLGKWLEEHRQARDNHDHEREYLIDAMLSSIEEDDALLSSYSRDTIIKAEALFSHTGVLHRSTGLHWPDRSTCSVDRIAHHRLTGGVALLYHRPTGVHEETLRLYPPGPITGPREATEDCHVGSHHIPKGTRLIVNIWKLHRDPRMWPDPTEFRPERFMTTNADLNYKGQNFEDIPFSWGRRSCQGMTFGTLVVQLVLARLVQEFDMKDWETSGNIWVKDWELPCQSSTRLKFSSLLAFLRGSMNSFELCRILTPSYVQSIWLNIYIALGFSKFKMNHLLSLHYCMSHLVLWCNMLFTMTSL
ncbi:Cytochrome P450 82A3 [Morus notabilis]|uniref:Cytochrome P450 82A3 n=1 Tax=Morus notabilis TaxID=981085 RepID=W9T1M5_9ROSA|nr:Cytochrome P450 82A3 [Morus notabilis]